MGRLRNIADLSGRAYLGGLGTGRPREHSGQEERRADPGWEKLNLRPRVRKEHQKEPECEGTFRAVRRYVYVGPSVLVLGWR